MNVSQGRSCKRVKNRGVTQSESALFTKVRCDSRGGVAPPVFRRGVSSFVGILQGGWSPCEEWARQDLEPTLQREGGIRETVC